MTGLATICDVDTGEQVWVCVATHATIKRRNNPANDMVKTVLCRLLLIQMAGQTVGGVRCQGNNIGDCLYRVLAVAIVVFNFTIYSMAHNAIASPMHSKNLTPSIKSLSPGVAAVVPMTLIAG